MGCGPSSVAPAVADLPVGLHDFAVERVIGQGGFGRVNAVIKLTGRDRGSWYAMKTLSKAVILQRRHVGMVQNERRLLAMLRCPQLTNLHYAFQDARYLYIVMDLSLGGDLHFQLNNAVSRPAPPPPVRPPGAAEAQPHLLQLQTPAHAPTHARRPFPELQVRHYAACIIVCLEYMHGKGVIHRDIKPENLLLDERGQLKLTDLGISMQLVNSVCTLTSGTRPYMAPEIFMPEHRHSFVADFYSLGITLFQLLLGYRPYRPESSNMRAIIRMVLFEPPEHYTDLRRIRQLLVAAQERRAPNGEFLFSRQLAHVTPEAREFISQCLICNPRFRLGSQGVQELLEHPWFRGLDWDAMRRQEVPSPFLPDVQRPNFNISNDDLRALMLNEQAEEAAPPIPAEDQAVFSEYYFTRGAETPKGSAPHRPATPLATAAAAAAAAAAVKAAAAAVSVARAGGKKAGPLPVTDAAAADGWTPREGSKAASAGGSLGVPAPLMLTSGRSGAITLLALSSQALVPAGSSGYSSAQQQQQQQQQQQMQMQMQQMQVQMKQQQMQVQAQPQPQLGSQRALTSFVQQQNSWAMQQQLFQSLNQGFQPSYEMQAQLQAQAAAQRNQQAQFEMLLAQRQQQAKAQLRGLRAQRQREQHQAVELPSQMPHSPTADDGPSPLPDAPPPPEQPPEQPSEQPPEQPPEQALPEQQLRLRLQPSPDQVPSSTPPLPSTLTPLTPLQPLRPLQPPPHSLPLQLPPQRPLVLRADSTDFRAPCETDAANQFGSFSVTGPGTRIGTLGSSLTLSSPASGTGEHNRSARSLTVSQPHYPPLSVAQELALKLLPQLLTADTTPVPHAFGLAADADPPLSPLSPPLVSNPSAGGPYPLNRNGSGATYHTKDSAGTCDTMHTPRSQI